mmetsp:Transcript_974/g.1383  ORF Transcript_974/g.1383 Transcript_974/m.1383 type:complete len:228 (-) Transcript_974:1527-2210(-)
MTLTDPSSSTSQLSSPNSSINALIVFPPGPISFPIAAGGIFSGRIFGALAASSCLGAARTDCISPRIFVRAVLAIFRVFATAPRERPRFFISNCSDVTPEAFPATLKSIIPNASSKPKISVRMRESSSATVVGSTSNPIATPATGEDIGIPASIIPKQQAHTVAILELPSLCVTKDSARIVYGNSPSGGIAGRRALCARSPWPTSRRPGLPTLPTSPIEHGGKLYCK